jgi:hypothetical protein
MDLPSSSSEEDTPIQLDLVDTGIYRRYEKSAHICDLEYPNSEPSPEFSPI